MSSSPPIIHDDAALSPPYQGYSKKHGSDDFSVATSDAEEGLRRRGSLEGLGLDLDGGHTSSPTAPSSSTTSSLMRQTAYQASGYHSDSAIPSYSHISPDRRRSMGSREMLDPAAEPLMGTDNDESDRERERHHHYSRRPSMDMGEVSCDDTHGRSRQAMLDFDKFRSSMEDWVEPRKSRWNRKVTRKRAKRPTTAVRKGRLAVYCVASELQTDQVLRYLLQRKKEKVLPGGGGEGGGGGGGGRGGGYYGTNGGNGGGGDLYSSFAPPAPPTLSTTNSSSLLLPMLRGGKSNSSSGGVGAAVTGGGSSAGCTGGREEVKRNLMKRVEDTSALVGLNWRDKNYMGVVYTTNDDGKCDPLEVKHIFCFPYGCTVFWGCTKEEEELFISMLLPFAVEPVSVMEREESHDDFVYLYGDSPMILHYEITLSSNDPEEKLALSFSLAQSAKLFVFEDRVDGTITSTKHIPIHLAEFGKINVSRREISKLTGKVFLERNEVNLHSDILDTPEWFWEADLWEPRYVAFCKYLDLPNRINILNKRLDILRELLNVLETQLDNSHSTKLELIVIALIIVEVVLQVLEIALNDLLHLDSTGSPEVSGAYSPGLQLSRSIIPPSLAVFRPSTDQVATSSRGGGKSNMSGPHGSTGTSSSIGGGAGEGGAMPPRPQMGANSSGSNNAGSWSSAGYHHQQHQHQQPQQQQLKQAQGQGVVSPMSALQRLLSLQRGQPLPLPANLVPPKPGGGVGGGSAMASSYQAGIAMNRNKRGFGAVMGGEGVKGMSDSGMSSTSIERREEGMMEGWRGHHQQQQMLSSAGSAAAAFLGTGLRGGKMTMDGSEETGGGGGRGKSMSPMTLRPPTSVEGRGRGVVMSSSNSLSASSEGDREEEEEKEEMGDDYNEELDGDESYSDSVEDGGGANGQKARAARKKAFASLSKEERVERRKEKARLYSHVARRRQESNMRELKAEMECLTVYRLIIEESPDMIVVLHPDLEGRVLFANAAFARGVEAMPGGYMGKPLWAVIHETHRGVVNDAIRNLLMNPETITRLKIQAKYPHPDYPGQGPMMDLTMRHTPTGLVCYMRQA